MRWGAELKDGGANDTQHAKHGIVLQDDSQGRKWTDRDERRRREKYVYGKNLGWVRRGVEATSWETVMRRDECLEAVAAARDLPMSLSLRKNWGTV